MPRESGRIWKLPAGYPHKGWKWQYCEDTGSPDSACEACGHPEVRYIHVLEHSDIDHLLSVGCICAGNLTDDYETAREQEHRVKTFPGRLARFMKREWKISDAGTYWLRYQGHLLWVGRRRGELSWWCAIDRRFSTTRFKTRESAKAAAYRKLYGPVPKPVTDES